MGSRARGIFHPERFTLKIFAFWLKNRELGFKQREESRFNYPH